MASGPPRQTAVRLAPLVYYVFDVLVLSGNDVRHQQLEARQGLPEREILPGWMSRCGIRRR